MLRSAIVTASSSGIGRAVAQRLEPILASSHATYISGINLLVDGGWMAY